MQTKTKKIVLGMVSGIFGLCAVSGLCLGGALSKANSVEPTVITMEKGASLRFNAGAPALRYFATLSDVKDDADYGMLIVNADALSTVTGDYHANLTAGDYTDVKCVPYVDNGTTYIRCALTGFSVENFNESYFTDYVAIGYEKVSGVYTYATVDETYGRSIVDAAIACDEMTKEWTAKEQEAIDYFVSVANSHVSDDFTSGITATYTAKNAKVDAYAEITANYDGAIATYLYSPVFEGMTEVEFDIYASTYAGWIGVAFGEQSSVYRTPALIQNTTISQHNAKTTKVNNVSFDLSKNWVNLKFVIASATEATLYINGTEAYKFTEYAGKEGKNYFDNGRVTISSSNAGNIVLVDNVKITHSNGVMTEDFSSGEIEMLAHGNVRFVNNKVNVTATQYQGNGFFAFDKSATTYNYAHGKLNSATYTGITEFGFDVVIKDRAASSRGFYVGFGSSTVDYPMFRVRDVHIQLNADCGTSDVGLTYNYDFTKKVSVKVVVTGATTAELYLDGAKVMTLTVTNTSKFTDLTGSQYAWFANGDNTGSARVDNLYVTTAAGTVMETFETVVSSSEGTGYNGTVVFQNASADKIMSTIVDSIHQGVETVYTYDVYKASNGLTVNQGYSVPETAEATDTVLFANVTLSGNAAGIVLGESATDKGMSLIVIENGKIFLRNVTDAAIVDGEAADLDITTAKSVAITMTAAGEVSVSVDGGEAVVLGTASYVGGNFSVLEVSGASALCIMEITLKMQVYA